VKETGEEIKAFLICLHDNCIRKVCLFLVFCLFSPDKSRFWLCLCPLPLVGRTLAFTDSSSSKMFESSEDGFKPTTGGLQKKKRPFGFLF